MTAAELLTNLRARGVRLSVEGERLCFDAPAGVMNPADLEQLSAHKAELLGALKGEAHIDRLLQAACQGLTITPEQLRQELEAGGDLADLPSGALTVKALRLTASTLALMRS